MQACLQCWLECKGSRALNIWMSECYYFTLCGPAQQGTKYLWCIEAHNIFLWNFHFVGQELLGSQECLIRCCTEFTLHAHWFFCFLNFPSPFAFLSSSPKFYGTTWDSYLAIVLCFSHPIPCWRIGTSTLTRVCGMLGQWDTLERPKHLWHWQPTLG